MQHMVRKDKETKGCIPTAETTKDAAVHENFLIRYKLAAKKDELLPFNINSFELFEIQDPFPGDFKSAKGSLDDACIQKMP